MKSIFLKTAVALLIKVEREIVKLSPMSISRLGEKPLGERSQMWLAPALKVAMPCVILLGLTGLLPWSGRSTDWRGDGNVPIPRPRQAPLRLSSRLVTVQVTVTDMLGRFVRGLQRRHFSLQDNGVEQQIAFFSSEDAPLSVGIIYDLSGSMRGIIRHSLEALRLFMDTGHPDDDYFLIGFNSRPELLGDFTRPADRILNRLTLAQPKGRTALYDAVYLGIEKVVQGAHAKRALLLISDGQDNSSAHTYRRLRGRVKESEILIYALGIIDRGREPRLRLEGIQVLSEITRMTGGRVFLPKTGPELVNVCAHIAAELRRQYSIGFYPDSSGRDKQWHKLKVKVHPPKGLPPLKVMAREGYSAY